MDTTIDKSTERKKIIQHFVTVNPDPNPSKCPNLYFYYKGSNEKFGDYIKLYNPVTGKVLISGDKAGSITDDERRKITDHGAWAVSDYSIPYALPINSYHNFVYVDYDEKNGMIELSEIHIDSRRPNKKLNVDKRKFEYNIGWNGNVNRVFLFKNDTAIYDINGNEIWKNSMKRYHNYKFQNYLNEITHGITISAIGKYINKFVYGSETPPAGSANLYYLWAFYREYYSNINRTSTTSSTSSTTSASENPTEKLVNEIVNKNLLKPISELNKEYKLKFTKNMRKTSYGTEWDDSKYESRGLMYLDNITDAGEFKGTIIRCLTSDTYSIQRESFFKAMSNGDTAEIDNRLQENPMIIFIDPQNTVRVLRYRSWRKKYIINNGSSSTVMLCDNVYNIIGNKSDFEANPFIKRALDTTKASKYVDKDRHFSEVFLEALRQPILSEIYEAGYNHIGDRIGSCVSSGFKDIFGTTVKKKGSLENKTGFTTKMLEVVNDGKIKLMAGFKDIKETISLDCSTLSDDDIEKIAVGYNAVRTKSSWWHHYLIALGPGMSWDMDNSCDEDKKSIAQILLNIGAYEKPTLLLEMIFEIVKLIDRKITDENKVLFNQKLAECDNMVKLTDLARELNAMPDLT